MEGALTQTQWGGAALLNAAFCLFNQMPFASAHYSKLLWLSYFLERRNTSIATVMDGIMDVLPPAPQNALSVICEVDQKEN